ncbi:ATP-binding protein [Streptomyces cyaneofuscatus]|uniref:ATP-binding protein n=1 Tax=Streptomyces cyaneofuscatus TaxID=66883 RepID=UPI0036463A99
MEKLLPIALFPGDLLHRDSQRALGLQQFIEPDGQVQLKRPPPLLDRGESRAHDVLLCVTELATNALRHGVPTGRGFRVQIFLERMEMALRVELRDSGDGRVRAADALPGVEDEGGRGLLLVGALADKWGVAERNPGKIVWCEFNLG